MGVRPNQASKQVLHLLVVLEQCIDVHAHSAQHVRLLETVQVDRRLEFHERESEMVLDSLQVQWQLGGGAHAHAELRSGDLEPVKVELSGHGF